MQNRSLYRKRLSVAGVLLLIVSACASPEAPDESGEEAVDPGGGESGVVDPTMASEPTGGAATPVVEADQIAPTNAPDAPPAKQLVEDHGCFAPSADSTTISLLLDFDLGGGKVSQQLDAPVQVAVTTTAGDDSGAMDYWAAIDFGTMQSTDLLVSDLATNLAGDTIASFSLAGYESEIDAMQFSGQLRFTARASDGRRMARSENVYFHKNSDGQLLLYDETVLQQEYHSGDFQNLHPEVHGEGVFVARMVDASGDHSSVDDQLEPELVQGEDEEQYDAQ